jgi:hypothetical protein
VTDPRAADTVPLNPPDVSTGRKRQQLEGEEDHADQDGALSIDEVETAEALTDTELYEGELETGASPDAGTGQMSLESLAGLELAAGATANPDVAAEEGETWVPPIDPPVIPVDDDPQGLVVAAGFGTTAEDEPFDADHHTTALPADDEVTSRVREAIAADSRTSRLANRVGVLTLGGRVILRGVLDDIEDVDLLAEVVAEVTGVVDVQDETEVEGL